MSTTTYSPDQYVQSAGKQLRPALITHSASRTTQMLADAAVPLFVLAVDFLTQTSAMFGPLAVLEIGLKLKSVIVMALTVLCWWGIFRAFGLYDREKISNRWYEARAVVLASSLCYGSYLILWPNAMFPESILNVFGLWLLTMTAALAVRFLLKLYEAEISPRLARKRNVVIVGTGRFALQLYEAVLSQRNWRVVGFVDCDDAEPRPSWVGEMSLGPLTDLEKLLMLQTVDEVSIALPVSTDYQRVQEVIAVCERVGVDVRHFSNALEYRLARAKDEPANDTSGVLLRTVHHDTFCLLLKRAVDIIAATLGLVLLSPVFVLAALGVALTSSGPVFFSQERYGFKKRRFKMMKFRTMCLDAEKRQLDLEHMNEATGPIFKIKNDPRITPIGKILRKSSIDELPQLYNVLRGDMSLVGPRPMSVRDVSKFSEAWVMRRFSVKPGITGLWQVSGRSNTSFEHWVQMDLRYIDHWSLGLDLEILLRTVPAVVRGTGAV